MIISLIIAYGAVALSSAAALAVLIRKSHSFAKYCFAAGMAGFALESLFRAIWLQSLLPEDAAFWGRCTLVVKSVLPAVWLAFSLTYSRGNAREYLARSRFLLATVLVLPLALTVIFLRQLAAIVPGEVASPAVPKLLSALLLVANVLILMNLERTIRSAVGTMRWRIKFTVLGLAIIFGTGIYTESQALLFSRNVLNLAYFDSGALVIGCALIGIGYLRGGFTEIDVYPSSAAIRTSITVLLSGLYLVVVGVLAQLVTRFGGSSAFPIETFIVLLGLAVLAVLLLSDRLRQEIPLFISRHFKRPQHDFRQIWTRFTQNLSAVLDESNVCSTSARLVSEILNALSVSVWLLDQRRERLSCVASTTGSEPDQLSKQVVEISAEELRSLPLFAETKPVNLEREEKDWRAGLQGIGTGRFRMGVNRIGLPLRAADQPVGLLVLADRVNGVPYTAEEMDLLKCIGDDIAAALLNIRLSRETLERKELEAFQTMSAFFIHDLKNAASTLGLTLQNLPDHFDDPAFREDALRGIKVAADRINHMISRLSTFRHGLRFRPAEIDLNALIREILTNLNGSSSAEIITKLAPLPSIVADREQLGSIITNLILNARDAIGSTGRITVETKHSGEWVTLSVSDDGCGMSAEFMQDSLFRPFHTTKKQGLGVGMFQAKMIVEAHSGNIEVKSQPGAGTTFEVRLPANAGKK